MDNLLKQISELHLDEQLVFGQFIFTKQWYNGGVTYVIVSRENTQSQWFDSIEAAVKFIHEKEEK